MLPYFGSTPSTIPLPQYPRDDIESSFPSKSRLPRFPRLEYEEEKKSVEPTHDDWDGPSHVSNPLVSEYDEDNEWQIGMNPPSRKRDNIIVIEEYDPNKVSNNDKEWNWPGLNKRVSKKVSTIKPMQFD